MKNYQYLLLILFIISDAYSQKYGNIWYFGDNAGIDFNNCAPSPLINGQVPPSEGCATICDTSGQILFYTNSDIVWNKLHNPMPNGNLVSSSGTLSQVLIIPKPSSQNIYYIITTQIQGQAALNLQYHTIDMSLNSGIGDVINKNNILTTATVTEQVSATYHSNGIDIWIVAHEYGNDKFLCYLVNSSGINPTPIISNVGPAIIPSSSGINARGEIKFSPNGLKVALNNNGIGTNPNSDYLCMFDFDNSTGIISSPINLPYERGGFGLSFSPDNSKLYAATWKAFSFSSSDSNKVYQFDISSNDSAMISNSKVILQSTPLTNGSPFGSLKLGPDGKIYVAISNSTYVGVINSPNQSGILCNYVNNGFYLGGKTVYTGLNNYIEYKTYCNNTFIHEYSANTNSVIFFQNAPNPFKEETTITYEIITDFGHAAIIFTDMSGNIIKEVLIAEKGKGQLNVFAPDLSSGIYTYYIVVDGKSIYTKKMVKE